MPSDDPLRSLTRFPYIVIGGMLLSMAIIRSLSQGSSAVSRHRTSVDATYQVLADASGTLFHLSTYGSDDRASEPKVSQTVQLERPAAADLIAALRQAFPGL